MPARWTCALLALYLLILVGAEATATNPADPDLWHRLAVGEYLWQTHHFPSGATFSYLADFQQIADHEWGSALVFYGAYSIGDGPAIVLIKIVSLALTLGLLVVAGLQGRRPTLLHAAFYALILLALLPSFQSTVRCMVFTHLFLALWLFWYQRERHGQAVPTWAYVAAIFVWANLHGGFTLGLLWLFGVTMVSFAQRLAWKPWALRFSLCTCATLLNPFGWHLWISTLRALFTTRRDFAEWGPVGWWPEVMSYPGYKLLLFVTLGALAWLIARRGLRLLDASAVIFIAGALVLSLLSARHTSLFAAVTAAFLPGLFASSSRKFEDLPPLRRLGFVGIGLTLTVVPLFAALQALPGDGLQLRLPANSCPVAAVRFLQQNNVRGDLLVPFNYGSYALWQLRGCMRVSMDGRYDLVYLPRTYRRVEDFFLARGPAPALQSKPPPAAVLLPISDPVYAVLKAEPGWTEAFHDSTDAVFLPLLKAK